MNCRRVRCVIIPIVCFMMAAFFGFAIWAQAKAAHVFVKGIIQDKSRNALDGVKVTVYRNDKILGEGVSKNGGHYEVRGDPTKEAITRVQYYLTGYYVADITSLNGNSWNVVDRILPKEGESLSESEALTTLGTLKVSFLNKSLPEDLLFKMLGLLKELGTYRSAIEKTGRFQ